MSKKITRALAAMSVALPIMMIGSGCSNHTAPTPTTPPNQGAQPATMPSVPPGVSALQQMKQDATQPQATH